MPEDFRATTLAGLIQKHRVSRAFLSPSAIIDLLDESTLGQYDLSSLTHVPYGSEMMPAPKIAEAIRRFGGECMVTDVRRRLACSACGERRSRCVDFV